MDPADCAHVYLRAKELLAAGDATALAQARDLLRDNAAQGHAPSCYRLAELILADVDQAVHASAVPLLRTAAEAGHSHACFLLGRLHAQGLAGVALDQAEAARWCTQAARNGLGVAQFNLGLLHAAGSGVAVDPATAMRWLRRAACNGVSEADGCLDILYDESDDQRPRTWAAAETRVSIALEQTDRDRPKTLRFAEYYVDPCIDLITQRFNLRREELEDVVQQFFLELEEPLTRGALRGKAWKEALRSHYDPQRGAFRPYLSRVLVNFVRDWIKFRANRDHSRKLDPAQESDAERFAADWRALLMQFSDETVPRRADAARAVEVLLAILVDNCSQMELATQLNLTDRTVRTALRLGIDLLSEWLERRIASLPATDTMTEQLLAGLELLPVWMHHPSVEKNARTLLFLAVVWRRLEAQVPVKTG